MSDDLHTLRFPVDLAGVKANGTHIQVFDEVVESVNLIGEI